MEAQRLLSRAPPRVNGCLPLLLASPSQLLPLPPPPRTSLLLLHRPIKPHHPSPQLLLNLPPYHQHPIPPPLSKPLLQL